MRARCSVGQYDDRHDRSGEAPVKNLGTRTSWRRQKAFPLVSRRTRHLAVSEAEGIYAVDSLAFHGIGEHSVSVLIEDTLKSRRRPGVPIQTPLLLSVHCLVAVQFLPQESTTMQGKSQGLPGPEKGLWSPKPMVWLVLAGMEC